MWETKQGNEEEAGASTEETQQAEAQSTASNSGADITIGLETDEGETAAVEIDEADQEELSGQTHSAILFVDSACCFHHRLKLLGKS